MLRDKLSSWSKQINNPQKDNNWNSSFGANDLNATGEYCMRSYNNDIDRDWDEGRPTEIAGGSNYWITHRTLYSEHVTNPTEMWFNQIAYGYGENNHIGIRCKSGVDASHKEPKWTDWEYTVMSGLIKEEVELKLPGGSVYNCVISRNRNSNIVSMVFRHIKVGAAETPFGKHYLGKITNSYLTPKPMDDIDTYGVRIIPIPTTSYNGSGYGLCRCCLCIESSGFIWLYNDYQDPAVAVGYICGNTVATYNIK